MKGYKNAIGSAIIMWIVGSCMIIFPVIYYVIDSEGKYMDIVMSISWLLGGLLTIYVAKKEYHINIKEYLSKPDSKILMLVIVMSIFYATVAMYVVYRPLLLGNAEIDTLTIIELVLASVANPIGEELTFRFAMLTLLLIASKNSGIKTFVSMVGVSVVWAVMHFSGYMPRNLEIIFLGTLIGVVYLKSKNVVYCIVIHSVVNAITFIFAALYPWFLEREYILYISLLLFLVSVVALMYHLNKADCGKFVLNVECELS